MARSYKQNYDEEYVEDFLTDEDDGVEILDDIYVDEDDDYDDDYAKKPEQAKHKNLGRAIAKEILSYIKILVIAALIALIITRFIIINAQVPTGSMESTININDRLIGFRLSYLFSEPQRGDIIIFKFPDNEKDNYVKRVIGTPGDVVVISGGKVYVNEVELSEDYIKEPMVDNGTTQTFLVPEDCYFVMGDNRNSSFDSRYWQTTHFVHKDKILAKVIFKYFNGTTKKPTFSTFK